LRNIDLAIDLFEQFRDIVGVVLGAPRFIARHSPNPLTQTHAAGSPFPQA
jgi:hypothetical protein